MPSWSLILKLTLIFIISVQCRSLLPMDQSIHAYECGINEILAAPYLVNAESTYHGEFPWHVAIYSLKGSNAYYKCGGTLLSTRTILTAAHCVTKFNTDHVVEEDDVLVYLGKHNLHDDWNGEARAEEPQQLIIHPSYNSSAFTGDIAMIILEQEVTVTKYVRPVCMWPRQEFGIDNFEGQLGTVVGWGRNQNDQISVDLQKAVLPIRSFEECVKSDRDFFAAFLTEKTFCAGYTNGTTPCSGDSGGGMVLKYDKHWYLRGLVSIGVPPSADESYCSKHHYTVFVDVAQYRDWILQHAPELQQTAHDNGTFQSPPEVGTVPANPYPTRPLPPPRHSGRVPMRPFRPFMNPANYPRPFHPHSQFGYNFVHPHQSPFLNAVGPIMRRRVF